MEDSIETIRETNRKVLVINRRKYRDEDSDTRRSMSNLRINPDTTLNIAQRLKTKSAISVSELRTLQNALIDDVNNIQVVLNINGALRGLVRELTGHEVSKQCAAAGICCNLALGDSRAGIAVSKAAGPYLVAALDNLTTELAVTSAWTLGNLAGSGPRATALIAAQGACAGLAALASGGSAERREAALYALVRVAHTRRDDLRTEHLHKMMEILPQCDVSTTSQLLFILSCHKNFTTDLVSQELVSKILQYLVLSVKQLDNENVTFLFRFLANSASMELFDTVLSFFLENNMLVPIRTLLEVNESVLWFFGNALKLCGDHVFFKMLLE